MGGGFCRRLINYFDCHLALNVLGQVDFQIAFLGQNRKNCPDVNVAEIEADIVAG